MKQVVIVGDAMADHLRIGRITRQSPEAPDCPVVDLEEERWELGGAANVARWLAAVEGLMVTYFGQWPLRPILERDRFEILCSHANIIPDSTLCPDLGFLTTKERLIVREGNRLRHLARVDSDTTMKASEARVATTLRRLREGYPSAAAIVVADYDKGVFRGDAGCQLALGLSQIACERGVPLIVNSKVIDRWRAVPVSCLICNQDEFNRSALASEFDDLTWVAGDAPWFAADLVLVTLGAAGVRAYCRGGGVRGPRAQVRDFPSLAGRVEDVTGAGDAFLAGLACEWLRHGFLLTDLVGTGQHWAAVCCEQVGVGTPIGGRLDC